MTDTTDRPLIRVPDLCRSHLQILVHGAGYKPEDPWRALAIIVNVALFQGCSIDPRVQRLIGGHIEDFEFLGCLACQRPDLFGEITQAVDRGLSHVKALGDGWIAAAMKDREGS